MKILPVVASFLAVLPSTLAVEPKKSAIVYYDNDQTPDSVIDKAMESIKRSGGKITHIFSIIKAFSVQAPQKALEMVRTMDAEYPARIEEDEIVTIE